jgi:integrase
MASLSTKADGSREIYVVLGKSRKKIQLGHISKKQADRILIKIEALLTSKVTGTYIDSEVASWVSSLSDEDPIFRRLLSLQLVQPRVTKEVVTKTLGQLIDEFETHKAPLIKARSHKKQKQCLAKLSEHFGRDRDILSITLGDASGFESWGRGKGASEAHQRTLNRYAKQLFNYAIEHELIQQNPFRKLKSTALACSKRHFVTNDDTKKILAACPSLNWKVLVGLARYAGLRVPSEAFSLTWGDVNLDKRSLAIGAHKTAARVCPIIPELFPILTEAKGKATGEKVLELSKSNIARRFPTIIAKAGLKQWDDLFQTLRRSFETHLISLGHPHHVVAEWLGHSVEVSKDHYLMVTSGDFEKATKLADPTQDSQGGSKSQKSGAYSGAASVREGAKPSAQISNESSKRKSSKTKSPGDFQGFRNFAKACGSSHKAPPGGLEPPTRGLTVRCSAD